MKGLVHKMAEFFRGEDFYTKGEDARLELTPEELRSISALLSENARLISKNKMLKEAVGKIKEDVQHSFVDLQDGSEEWRSYVNDAVLEIFESIEKHMEGLI